MEIFQCEDTHLLSFELLNYVTSKLDAIYMTLYKEDDIKSQFQRQTWQDSLHEVKKWNYSTGGYNHEFKHLYKSCLSFYMRGVLKSTLTAIPKLHYFLKQFMNLIIDTPAIKNGTFFARYNYADRLKFIQMHLRVCLNQMLRRKVDGGYANTGKYSEMPLSSIGPGDSVSVAPFSRLRYNPHGTAHNNNNNNNNNNNQMLHFKIPKIRKTNHNIRQKHATAADKITAVATEVDSIAINGGGGVSKPKVTSHHYGTRHKPKQLAKDTHVITTDSKSIMRHGEQQYKSKIKVHNNTKTSTNLINSRHKSTVSPTLLLSSSSSFVINDTDSEDCEENKKNSWIDKYSTNKTTTGCTSEDVRVISLNT